MWGKQKKTQGSPLHTLGTGTLDDYVQQLVWSPTGEILAAASISGPITILSGANGSKIQQFLGHSFGTCTIAFHPKDPLLASGGSDGKIRIWSLAQADPVNVIDDSAWVEQVVWSRDGLTLATAAGKCVRLWSYPEMTLIRKIDGLEGTVSSLNWHPKQHTLAIAAYGGITLADRDQQELRTLAWRGAPLVAAWSPDGKMIAHGNQDATVHFWYPETNVELQMSGFPAKVGQIAWEFTSRTLATGGGPAAYLWDCSGKGPEGSRPKMLQGHRDLVTALVYQQRGFLLASGGRDGRLCVWQPANRTPLIAGAEFPEAEISSLAWSPNDQFLAVGTSSGGIGIFKVK